MARRRQQGAGTVRQLPSGRWQVRYRDETGARHGAPMTFLTKQDAVAWLASGDRTALVSAASDPSWPPGCCRLPLRLHMP